MAPNIKINVSKKKKIEISIHSQTVILQSIFNNVLLKKDLFNHPRDFDILFETFRASYDPFTTHLQYFRVV